MDSSINQLDTDTSLDVLRQLVCTPGHVITEKDLRSTGVDVNILESMYITSIKPYLDYLHGYERLEELDPRKDHRRQSEELYLQPPGHRCSLEVLNGTNSEFLWDRLLAQCGMLAQHTKARLVVKASLYADDVRWTGPSYVTVAFYLTRNGKWLFWYIDGDPGGGISFKNEKLSVHDTVREAWETAHALVPDFFTTRNAFSPVKYLPLLIEQGLQNILRETIKERDRRLNSLKSALDSAERRSAIIHM
ncbi:MAG TPA: hypothetical protein VF281_02185 [Candidatus Saccharimonadales bacterium]